MTVKDLKAKLANHSDDTEVGIITTCKHNLQYVKTNIDLVAKRMYSDRLLCHDPKCPVMTVLVLE